MGIRKDTRLAKTPFRAMNPRAGRVLGMPYMPKAITYGVRSQSPLKRRVMDIRHEIIEFDEMGKGKEYKTAHRIANRKQRIVGAEG